MPAVAVALLPRRALRKQMSQGSSAGRFHTILRLKT
jgi:hypothetical protein